MAMRFTPTTRAKRNWSSSPRSQQKRGEGTRAMKDRDQRRDEEDTRPVDVPGAEYAERALMALALDSMAAIRQPAIHEVRRVRLEKFRDFHHRAVAEVIQARSDRGEDCDLITVFEDLKYSGHIGDGGACVFHDLTDFGAMYLSSDLTTSLDPEAYARQIHRAYAQRITIERARDLYTTATKGIDEITAALPIIVTEISAANKEADPESAFQRFAPVDLREWRKRPRARMLDAEMNLREGQTLMIYGETNSGKTLYLIHRLALLACGVSTGEPEHVLYYCGEGQSGIMGRIEATLLYHHLDVETFYDHFHLVPDMPQLAQPEEVAAAIELAQELDVPFTVFAIDTLTTAMNGLNDNSSEFMTAVAGGISQIKRELGATPIIVHHPGKDGARGPRGSSTMKNGLDLTLEVSQPEKCGVITIRPDKSREGSKRPQGWAYRIVQQALEGDEWCDDPQPALEPGATPTPRPVAPRAKLDATAMKVWKILDDAGGARWVAWQGLCEAQGINAATAKSAMFRLKDASRVGKVEDTGEWKALPDSESG